MVVALASLATSTSSDSSHLLVTSRSKMMMTPAPVRVLAFVYCCSSLQQMHVLPMDDSEWDSAVSCGMLCL